MAPVDTLATSFVEGAHHTAHAANTLAAAAKDAPTPPAEVCTLIPGMFGIGIQLALCVISVIMLLVKYSYETPKRPKKVFLMDFIQLMCGSSTVHLLNIISSILINKINVSGSGAFVQDECNMYFMTTVFDATIGVYIEYRIIRYLAIRRAAHNYLQKNRKSMFTPTLQELADAKLFATRSINSLGVSLLGPTSSISTAASLYSPGLAAPEEQLVPKPGFFGGFNFFKPKLPAAGDALALDGDLRTLRTDSVVEVVDLEALRGAPLYSQRSGGLRPDSLIEVKDRYAETELADARALEESPLELRDQFTHELDDTTTVDEEEDLLLEDELPNPSHYSSSFFYNLSSFYARFSKWSRKRANREFLLNLYTWLLIVSGLKCVSIVLFTIFSYHINLVTSYLLDPFSNSHRLKLIFVMIICPLFLNVFQYYVTDSIIKIKIPLN